MLKKFNLKRNMSLADQIFRSFLGLLFIYLGPLSDVLTDDFLSSALLTIVGMLVILSSFLGFCPLYHVAGFNTYTKKQKAKNPD